MPTHIYLMYSQLLQFYFHTHYHTINDNDNGNNRGGSTYNQIKNLKHAGMMLTLCFVTACLPDMHCMVMGRISYHL